jgi:hypothetical protein
MKRKRTLWRTKIHAQGPRWHLEKNSRRRKHYGFNGLRLIAETRSNLGQSQPVQRFIRTWDRSAAARI